MVNRITDVADGAAARLAGMLGLRIAPGLDALKYIPQNQLVGMAASLVAHQPRPEAQAFRIATSTPQKV